MRQYFSALLWIAGTTIVVAGAQVITTRAAAERRAVTRLNIELVENTVRVRELEAELRTRAGMPELQRWNDAVFQLTAPQGGQILRSPVQLASFAARPDSEPRVQYAVASGGPAVATPLPPAGESSPVAAATARLVRTSYEEPATPAATAPQGLPDDLLAELPADPVEPQDGRD
jgi:hypothetical protein